MDSPQARRPLVAKSLLEPISRLVARIRESHYFNTYSWADSGARLLPTALFMEYSTMMRQYKDQFHKLVSDMLTQYPYEVQLARARLGTMYDPGDYPDPLDLNDRFAIKLEFTPVPDAEDFRVDLPAEAQIELRASVTQAVADRQADAVKACYSRIFDVVSKIEERLSDPDAVFKDSLITNAIELCRILDALNITDDQDITYIIREMRDNLLMPPSVLRTNQNIRARTALAAHDILQRIPNGLV